MVRDVKDSVVRRLSPDGLALLAEIEQFAGIPVQMVHDSAITPPPNAHSMSAGVKVTERSALINFLDPDVASMIGVVHELLHIRRYWIDNIPILKCAVPNPNLHLFASHFDNDFEHLVIAPEEMRLDPDSVNKWDEAFRKQWRGLIQNHGVFNEFQLRLNCLQAWVGTKALTKNSELEAAADSLLREVGLLDRAQSYRDGLLKRVGKKPMAIAYALKRLRIDRDPFRLIYVDPRAKTVRQTPIPESM